MSASRPEGMETPAMLDQLEAAYEALLARAQAPEDDARRLRSVASDLRWYAERLGPARWEEPPRLARWSYAENLWHIASQAIEDAQADTAPRAIVYYTDHGKEHVGQAAEIYALFEY